MAELFSITTIKELGKRLREPPWMTQLRYDALATHHALPWPHPSDDVWRRVDVSLLDPLQGFAPTVPGLLELFALTDAQVVDFTQPLGEECLLVRANGTWLGDHPQPRGIVVEDLAAAAHRWPDSVRRILTADGMTEAEQKLASLNAAFHHDDLFLRVSPGMTLEEPIRLVHLFSASPKCAIFPMTILVVGAGSTVTLIDEYVSVPPAGDASHEPHQAHSRIELILEPQAKLHYVRLQRWGATAREFLLQRAMLAEGAQLTLANLNLGAALSKAHIITTLHGPHASSQLYGFVFGRDRQHVDQHTLQDHRAPHTSSDLQVRAALQDHSHLVYTGLIRIAKEAVRTEAFQANHNLMLSAEAKAETIPMLEILADDVQCKHGASIGPIDDEQAFYLMSRGLPRRLAERLIVMGFVEPTVLQVPFAPLQERLRHEIEGSLHDG